MELAQTLAALDTQLQLLAEHWGQFSEAELLALPGPGRWCKKEVLGHLIDSAANNHRRFVLAQVAPAPLKLLPYDQDGWVRAAHYRHLPAPDLLALWTSYNRLIRHLLAHIPAATLATECFSLHNNPVTLGWVVTDYVLHLEHHVRQIIHE
ncbi:DinB family protein [Hymenobacter sp. BT523]|uniref:DinB family protein n=1 Tax=Hymenobacter sp. BT523 TaxID=2795725 RepID=UPI0018EDD612|nr:DinB family protein [Hymenobacter sp. BT523]MBJ6108678.1 DinB family protein [Hymenobacter sp. BT523]